MKYILTLLLMAFIAIGCGSIKHSYRAETSDYFYESEISQSEGDTTIYIVVKDRSYHVPVIDRYNAEKFCIEKFKINYADGSVVNRFYVRRKPTPDSLLRRLK
jgi:hypothetical protein